MLRTIKMDTVSRVKRRGPYKKHVAIPETKKPRTTAWLEKTKRNFPVVSAEDVGNGACVPGTADRVDFDSCQNELSCTPNMERSQACTRDASTQETVSRTVQLGLSEPDNDEFDDRSIFESQEQNYLDDESEVSSDEDSNEDDPHYTPEEPLYAGSRISLAVSIFLILTFATRHGLSGEALKDLLALIEIHCLAPNLCGNSAKYLHDFFLRMKSPIQLNYFCNSCQTYLGKEQCVLCQECGKDDVSYFISMSVVNQLQKFFKCQEFTKLLNYRQTRKKEQPENIEDVYDGQLYNEIFEGQHFRGSAKSSEIHLSCQMNTDGVALFRSSSYSIWPQYMVVNELPPEKRYSRKYRMFCGLWFGKAKAVMDVFLKPLITEFQTLYNEGFKAVVSGKQKVIRCILLSVVCDAPARCLTQKFTQFNGFFGCPTCKAKGESVKTSDRGSTLTYPFQPRQANFYDGHAEERNHLGTLEDAQQAELNRKAVNGVKGFSLLLTLPHFNIIRGVAVDYMHCVLLGVVKRMLNLWTDKTYRQDGWFIGKSIQELNERMLSITPPRTISRSPKGFSDLSQWKASEFRSFLLFYSVPCLWGILPSPYLEHYLLLVHAMCILLKSSISLTDVRKAKLMLIKFCAGIEEHYGQRYSSSNVHALLHLCKKVTDLGPLHFHSCFFFEDLNKDLRNFFHGTQRIELQILTAVTIQQHIPTMLTLLTPGSAAERLYLSMTRRFSSQNQTYLLPGVFAVGHMRPCTLSDRMKSLIDTMCGRITSSFQFFRLLKEGIMFHCREYKCVSKRNSYTVQYEQENILKFGKIQYFLKCVKNGRPTILAVVKPLIPCDSDLALPVNIFSVKEDQDHPSVPILITKVKFLCVWLQVKGRSERWVGTFPNILEGD